MFLGAPADSLEEEEEEEETSRERGRNNNGGEGEQDGPEVVDPESEGEQVGK